ncbi:hypothetical protein HELRODRAFT_63003 [Helobdella robusta]|uniref:Suppressor of forked domain-containing protein n=1 Tax=Helobdella robusta TaxID=6412 RepID=T1FX95_HELRO|nr:hypothetical protein HELRODRAFT_63003 [Helobdella robusta]ESO12555.1 hypothetical protein HELRODRAFT_63003 [Helobdella robusta]
MQNDVIVTNSNSHDNATKSEIISIARKKDLNSNEKRLELEKATLMEPNSSLVWLNLLAFDIESGEIERAREVGVRAIKTISYREEKEKLNVWMGCINMEYQYGCEESLKEITDSALKCCDPYKIYCHVRDMYSADQKVDKAEEVCKILLKKYKTNPDVWVSYGQILFKFNRLDQARLIMMDSLDRLDKKHYIELVTKYALLESKYGNPENAETLLESLVTGHPKRTDVWSMYIDLCVKQGRIEQARSLLQRCTKLSLPTKKVKFLVKKFLNFELMHGTEAAVEEVKEMSKSLITDELTDD